MKAPVTFGHTLEMDIVSFEVADQSIQETIAAAGYGYVNESVSKSEALARSPGKRHAAVWHPNLSISSDAAERAIRSTTCTIDGKPHRGRPATIEELASYDHEELGDTILVALGEKVRDGSDECVAYRSVYASERRLNLSGWTNVWPSRCRFLVVFEFEEVSVPA
jgi:hypothetical protein